MAKTIAKFQVNYYDLDINWMFKILRDSHRDHWQKYTYFLSIKFVIELNLCINPGNSKRLKIVYKINKKPEY